MRAALALLALLAPLAAGCAAAPAARGPAVQPPRLATEDGLLWATLSDGARLPLRVTAPPTPPRGLVLALHGFNDYGAAWDEAGRWFAAHELALYAPDLRGFGQGPLPGRWPGHAAQVADVIELLRLVQARRPDAPLFLMGESMGAALALLAAAEPAAPPLAGVALLAPALWDRRAMGPVLAGALDVLAALAPGFPLTGGSGGPQASDNLDALRRLGRDPLVLKSTRLDAAQGLVDLMDAAQAAAPRLRGPALIVYGLKDQLVPEHAFRRFAAALPDDKTITAMVRPEGWHLLLRDRDGPAVAAQVIAWMVRAAGLPPSGPPSGPRRSAEGNH